jgi:16S rRNA processing protein RimM
VICVEDTDLTNDLETGNKIRHPSTRGSVEKSAEPRFVTIGRVTKPHGVHGEVRVIPLTDLPKRFTWLKHVYVGETQPRRVAVLGARSHQDFVLLRLDGYVTRESAEELRNQILQVPEEEAIPLEEGEYYLFQAIGLQAITENGDRLGRVTEILETGANNVFVIAGDSHDYLIPDIPEAIREVDIENGRLIVRLMPGLIEGFDTGQD